ncbi:MAG: NADP-dependent oxidoreductase [Acetobacteraceae bacterium]|nr:NADP-dependent oxidoreductase [Acetobacteraceae bacterium]
MGNDGRTPSVSGGPPEWEGRMPAMMRAVRFHDYGGPEVLVLEDVPKPEPGAGQVLIRIRAASVNPIDWKLRAGLLNAMFPVQFPAIAGQDLAGTVDAVGEGVTDLKQGDAVFAMTASTQRGAYAEYVALDRAAVAVKPASLDFVAAAAVPMGALTAWQGVVEAGGLKAGDQVFVHAAAGNVGGMAVQIAHALGAHVTAGAAGDSRSLVSGYGADRFVDYGSERFEDTVQDMDIVFDTLAGDMQARSWAMLKRGGILVSTLGIGDAQQAEARGVRAAGFGCVPDGGQLARIAAMIDRGQIRPRIGAVLPLAEAAKAQSLNESGAVKGKIVLIID